MRLLNAGPNSLSFKPINNGDGKWHRIKINVTPLLDDKGKKFTPTVRSREGYFAL